MVGKRHTFPFLYHGMCFYLFFTGAILSVKFNKRKCSLVRFLSLPLLLFVPFHNFMKNIFVVLKGTVFQCSVKT